MNFWDSSGIVSLLVEQPGTRLVSPWAKEPMAVWWQTRSECIAAIHRLGKELRVPQSKVQRTEHSLLELLEQAAEVQPTEPRRTAAERLLRIHSLRTADAYQLAAALALRTEGHIHPRMVCLDKRLREAAILEGIQLLPEELIG